jgi:hypothetical protein
MLTAAGRRKIKIELENVNGPGQQQFMLSVAQLKPD